ncbi:MAG: hypothetical protein SZ59_C0006G0004 [candidate division TM6 bacterium GW2011_GWF2_28_16]|nr:MAG: hypothetical protein SZ59_C0006G0004 [candidate division TM6 bacterium GW2011_GWF2_28_16]
MYNKAIDIYTQRNLIINIIKKTILFGNLIQIKPRAYSLGGEIYE